MIEWIDGKIDYLHPKMDKKYALFEPTNEFYENLENIDEILSLDKVLRNIDENKPPYFTFDEATKGIEKHLGWSIPRIKFYPLERNINGRHTAGKIQVGGEIREIQISIDYKKKARQLGTILAHEIAHDFLFSKGIKLTNLDENEKLTDLTSIMLGLGKLALNGIEERKLSSIIKLCYLSSEDIAYAYVKFNSLNEVPIKNYFTNLKVETHSLVKSFFNETEIKKAIVEINSIKEKYSIAQKTLDEVKNANCQINNNQDLINKNIRNIKIDPADGIIFVDLNSYLFKFDIDNFISQLTIYLNDANKKLDNEQKNIAIDTIETTIQHLKNLDNTISQRENEAEGYLKKLFEALSIQEKYIPNRSSILENRFKELIKKGRIKEALKLAKKNDCNLLNKLGVESAKKKDKIAFKIFKKILLLDPNNAIAYYNLGCACFSFKQYNEAIRNYQMAVKVDPNNATAYYNIGNAYFNLKQYCEAFWNYRMAIQLNPNNHMFHEAIIEVCSRLKEQDPNNVTIYSISGNAHFILKQYLKALENYQMALKLNPDDYTIQEKLKKTFTSFKKQDGLVIYVMVRIKYLMSSAKNKIIFLVG